MFNTNYLKFVTTMLGLASLTVIKAAGITYSFATLAQMPESGVTYTDGCYIVNKNDTIAEGDLFVLDEDVTVKFADQVWLVIQGEARLKVSDGHTTTLTRTDDTATPYGIKILSDNDVEASNITFEHLGLQTMGSGMLTVSHCKFIRHNGSAAAALYVTTGGERCTVSDCHFESCAKAGISTSANASRPLTITNSEFIRNSTNNQNIPQINITAADILIKDCTILGDSTSTTVNNMVGGIGVSNFAGFTNTQLTISHCDIRHNRYGIGTVGPVSQIRIEDNVILDNNHESNAMNGGSGISFYDPYRQTNAIVAGNRIEGSLWGITIIGCHDVNIGQPTATGINSPGGNTFNGNGNGGQLYDLYNNSDLTVYAQNNRWGVAEQTEAQIETVVFHQNDDPSLGKVIFMPAASDTAIPSIEAEQAESRDIYTIQGIRLNSTPKHGLFIQNGKKHIR